MGPCHCAAVNRFGSGEGVVETFDGSGEIVALGFGDAVSGGDQREKTFALAQRVGALE